MKLQSATSLRRLVSVLVVQSDGRVSEETRSITALKEESRLHMRELLIVEQPSSLIQPRILPRRHCIVLTMGAVRAIIFTDRVYLFSSALLPGAKDFATTLSSLLQQAQAVKALPRAEGGVGGPPLGAGVGATVAERSERDDPAPFELLIIEQALLMTTLKQGKRVAYAHKLLDRLLSKMGTVEKDDGNLYALFPLANTISHYELITRGICECVRALLDDDRDMREACLSDKAKISRELAEEAVAWSKAQAASYADAGGAVEEEGEHGAAIGGRGGSAGLGGGLAPRSTPVVEGAEAFSGVQRSPIATTRVVSQFMSLASLRSGRPGGEEDALVRTRDRATGLPLTVGLALGGAPPPRAQFTDAGFLSASSTSGGGGVGGGGGAPEDSRILRVSPDALSQLELMLESVYHRAAELNMEAVELGRTIKNKQDLLELQQSNYRNFILSVTLRMSVLSVSIASASFVTSAFGQNLVSGAEHVPGGMWGVTLGSVVLGFYNFKFLYRATVSSSPTAAYARRLQTFSDFLFKLDSKVDAARNTLAAAAGSGGTAALAAGGAALAAPPFSVGATTLNSRVRPQEFGRFSPFGRTSGASGGDDAQADHGDDGVDAEAGALPSAGEGGGSPARARPLSREEFKHLHARTTGRLLSDDEVELLFDIFDTDSDGKLRIEEVVDVGTLSMGQPVTARPAKG